MVRLFKQQRLDVADYFIFSVTRYSVRFYVKEGRDFKSFNDCYRGPVLLHSGPGTIWAAINQIFSSSFQSPSSTVLKVTSATSIPYLWQKKAI